MKVTYRITYKNGLEDIIEQEGTEEELNEVNKVINESMKNNMHGVIRLGDGKKKGYFIRLDDISRVSIDT